MHCSPAEMQQYADCSYYRRNLRDGEIDIMGLLVASGLCASRSEARRAVTAGRSCCKR